MRSLLLIYVFDDGDRLVIGAERFSFDGPQVRAKQGKKAVRLERIFRCTNAAPIGRTIGNELNTDSRRDCGYPTHPPGDMAVEAGTDDHPSSATHTFGDRTKWRQPFLAGERIPGFVDRI